MFLRTAEISNKSEAPRAILFGGRLSIQERVRKFYVDGRIDTDTAGEVVAADPDTIQRTISAIFQALRVPISVSFDSS